MTRRSEGRALSRPDSDGSEAGGVAAAVGRWIAAGIVVLGMAVVTALWMPAPASAQSAVGAEIPLKLFERTEINLAADCGLALWQASRDPARDRFAVVFSDPAPSAGEASARIKVGGDIVALTKVASAVAEAGRGVAPVQLYRTAIGDYVILDLALAPGTNGSVAVTGGTLAVVMRGRPVFRVSVAGRSGCADGTGQVVSSASLENR